MKKKLGGRKPLPDSAFNNNTLFTFLSICLTILDAYPTPPASLPIALYTLFRKNVNRITAGLVYDAGSSQDECIVATSVMAMRCGVPIDRLCGAVQALAPELVTIPTDGPMYMNSFRPLKRSLTEHGNELVINDKGRAVYDIENPLDRRIGRCIDVSVAIDTVISMSSDTDMSTSTSVTGAFRVILSQHETFRMIVDQLSHEDTGSLMDVVRHMKIDVTSSVRPLWWRNFFVDMNWVASLDPRIYKAAGHCVEIGPERIMHICVVPLRLESGFAIRYGHVTKSGISVIDDCVMRMTDSLMYGVGIMYPELCPSVRKDRSVRTVTIVSASRLPGGHWMMPLDSRTFDRPIPTEGVLFVADLLTGPSTFTIWDASTVTSTSMTRRRGTSMALGLMMMMMNS
ncbi:hypothetical protein B0J12DRAFT_734466 [Macrophomina phaseolina]|uniref:Uncharacterized protein n=1 Tax=Macrophomina phaseolina TaxID=35725 RepID=A0ABQ8GV11_9PEZI|nr:hypothetical protein B0J12DRAFT_734466 [Macrophomina phaseolina]